MKLVKHSLLTAAAALVLLTAGCGQETTSAEPDAVSYASPIFYADSALTGDTLALAIQNAEGSCTIATVNEDGSPNLIVAVPGMAGSDHLMFGWADNVTKANVLRTGQAVVSYYLYDKDAEDKMARNMGARMICEPETDPSVIESLMETPGAREGVTFLKITEILPLG